MRTNLLTILFPLLISISAFSQNVILDSLDTSLNGKVKFEIQVGKTAYDKGEKIKIQYNLTNISKSDQKILIKDYYGFPMGVGASIINDNDTSICKYSSRHILSSQIFTTKELENKYKTLKPKQKLSGDVILQDVPVFKDYSKDYVISTGHYTISMSFFTLISNQLIIEIK